VRGCGRRLNCAHFQSVRLEAWSNEREHPGLRDLCAAVFKRLDRPAPDLPSRTSDTAHQQLSLIEVAESVFDLCDATAWHALAPPSASSLNPVAPAYARLKAALKPATDETIHHLMERFDLARVYLLAVIVSLDIADPRKRLPLPPPFTVREQARAMTVNCEGAHVQRAMFVDALRGMTDGSVVTPSRISSDGPETLVLPNGIRVEVTPHRVNGLLVGDVTARWP
jgi:hypothetical protein